MEVKELEFYMTTLDEIVEALQGLQQKGFGGARLLTGHEGVQLRVRFGDWNSGVLVGEDHEGRKTVVICTE